MGNFPLPFSFAFALRRPAGSAGSLPLTSALTTNQELALLALVEGLAKGALLLTLDTAFGSAAAMTGRKTKQLASLPASVCDRGSDVVLALCRLVCPLS